MATLSPALTAAARTLRLAAHGMLADAGLAQHRRRRLGHSRVFFEHRAYTPGDDTRSLDWRAFARTGRPVLKRFEDEGQLSLLLGIDASASMHFGDGAQRKLWPACQLAQALGELALRQDDAVGLWWLHQPQGVLAPRAHRGMAQMLATHLAQEGTASPRPIKLPGRTLWPLRGKRPHRVVLLGDWLNGWLEPPSRLRALLQTLRARGHVTHVVRVVHPLEAQFPFAGIVPFAAGPEAPWRWAQSEAARGPYLEAMAAFGSELTDTCRLEGAPLLEVQSGDSLVPALSQLAQARRLGAKDVRSWAGVGA